MKKITLLIILVSFAFVGLSQETDSKFDIRIGVGPSFLGTGDMRMLMFENQVNLKLNSYFTVSGSAGIGKSTRGVFEQSSFVQFNSNIYISPFKNSGINDFRIGTGLSWYSVSDAYQKAAIYEDGQLVSSDYVFDNRNSFGINLIIENSYSITDKFLIGVKVLAQPYFNGDRNTGALLKFGWKIN